ncbi:MAG: PEP/pyruvate-binding domain-containing protein [Deltaproteobacteria bacterium]|nr:PEP/pyruvate-binding domain-containing protein [Myxococcales bacterium]MDP3221010.1 PEP/pyruvate-binding domain-containing protein [Deltaproteobacteria bacterium]
MIGAVGTPTFIVFVNGLVLLLLVVPTAFFLQSVFRLSWDTSLRWALVLSTASLVALALAFAWLWRLLRARDPVPLVGGRVDSALLMRRGGRKVQGLVEIAGHGFCVARGWVLLGPACRRVAASARAIARAAREQGVRRLIVRSAFLDEDEDRLHAGVFESIADVAAGDEAAIAQAIERVLASHRADPAAAYRRRLGLGAPAPGGECVLVQAQVPHEVFGIIASQDASRRRPDLCVAECEDVRGDTERLCYSHLLSRWIAPGRLLDDAQREALLSALRRAEAWLEGPALVEFGVTGGQLIVYQLRRAPAATMSEVYTNTGGVFLNPEPLARLWSEILYGAELGRLKSRLAEDLAELSGAARPPAAPRLTRFDHRPYVEYAALARVQRYTSMRRDPVRWLARLCRDARASESGARDALAAASAPLPDGPASLELRIERVRHLGSQQARVQFVAGRVDSFRALLDASPSAGGAASPSTVVRGAIAGVADRCVAGLHRHRQALRAAIERELAAIAVTAERLLDEALPGGGGAWASLRLADLQALAAGRGLQSSLPSLEEEARSFAAASPACPPILLREGDDTTLRPADDDEEAAAHAAAGEHLALTVLVPGEARGRVVAASDAPADGELPGEILLLPDGSLRWLPRLLDARGLLFVGGARTLSHLSLTAIEAGIPSLVGLTPAEGRRLVGSRVHIGPRGLGVMASGEVEPD